MSEEYYKWHKFSERLATMDDMDERGHIAVVTKNLGVENVGWGEFDQSRHTHWFPLALPKLPTPPEKTQEEKDQDAAAVLYSKWMDKPGGATDLAVMSIKYGRAEERKRLAKDILEYIEDRCESTLVSRGRFVSLIEINNYLKTLIN